MQDGPPPPLEIRILNGVKREKEVRNLFCSFNVICLAILLKNNLMRSAIGIKKWKLQP